MRILVFLKALFLILLVTQPVLAQEVIHHYNTEVLIQTNGSLFVKETIEVMAEGQEIKRGIYRDFPNYRRTFLGGIHPSPHQVLSVKRNGATEPYHTEETDNGDTRLYIGSYNMYLPKGSRHTYEINYRVPSQVFFENTYDELFWNVIGTNWSFPISKATATIILPKGAEAENISVYTGPNLSTENNSKSSVQGNKVYVEATRPLGVKEGMSVAVSFSPGLINAPKDMIGAKFFWKQHPGLFWVILSLLSMILYYGWAWDRVGRDPKGRGIIARYNPPPGISPAMAAYIREMGGASTKTTLTSAIMSLASQGYLEIKELKKKRYQIKRTDKTETAETMMSIDESVVYDEMGMSVTLSRSSRTMMAVAKEHNKVLKDKCKKTYFHLNILWWMVGIIPLLTAIAILVAVTPIAKDAFLGGLLFTLIFGGIGLSVCIYGLRVLITGSIKEKFTGIFMAIWGAGFSAGGGIGVFMLINSVSWLVIGILILMVIIIIWMFTIMRAPTVIGREVMDHIEGFRLYMKAVEEKVLQRFDPPQMSRELYEKYLPYAVALDVESKWADKFAKVTGASLAATAAASSSSSSFSPSWYHGSSSSLSNFSISDMASSIGSSIASASSSSSSSGGGSSGGGGGGGGGGGW